MRTTKLIEPSRLRRFFLTFFAVLVCTSNLWADVNANDYKLPGAFSVSPTKQVWFSQGNLQYQANNGNGGSTWRFAEHQWDIIGYAVGNITTVANRANQTDWIDLFGWGTSGWDNGNRTAYQPWSYSTSDADYGVKATKSADEALTGDYANADWGVYNSAQLGEGWRTLTDKEWGYILGIGNDHNAMVTSWRPNASFLRGLCKITIGGTQHPGLVIMPDGWTPSSSDIATKWATCAVSAANMKTSTAPTLTEEEWTILESEGAVFLPTAGRRNNTGVSYESTSGYYWTARAATATHAYLLFFGGSGMAPRAKENRKWGMSVRLASDIAPRPVASLETAPAAIHGLVYTGSAQALVTAGTATNGTIYYALDNGIASTTPPTASEAGVYTVSYKVVGDAGYSDYAPATNTMRVSIAEGTWDGDLSTTTENKTAGNGTVITGTLSANVKISIASGATVTLNNATISGVNNSSYPWSGITCQGDATIILEGTNTITGFYQHAGIEVPENATLTIEGTGSLNATGKTYSAGIGSSNQTHGGNIVINGGTITAVSGSNSAGIGAAGTVNKTYSSSCGDITINGGTITATGSGAGIGAGYGYSSCGNITINGGTVTTTGGSDGAGIGSGMSNNSMDSGCGDITINGGTITATGGSYASGIGSGYYSNSYCGKITINRGEIVATMGTNAQPIGAGYRANCETVTVHSALTDDNGNPTRTISTSSASLTSAPTAKSLTFNGSAQELVNAGSAEGGYVYYSLDETNWSENIPTAINAGDYTVYYKVINDGHHYDYTPSPNTVAVHISKATPTVTAPTAITELTYNGSTQALVDAGSTDFGTLLYSLDNTNWSEDIPEQTNADVYTVYYKVEGNDNVNSDAGSSVAVTIAQASATITEAPTPVADLTYDGTEHSLVSAGSVSAGTMKYSLDDSDYSTTIPTASAIGTHRVYYMLDGGQNYTSVSGSLFVETTIAGPRVADNADPSTTLTALYTESAPMSLLMNRTIYADGDYNTICLPFDVSESDFANPAHPLYGYERLKAFRGAQVSGSGQDLSIDVFVQDATEIIAGVPYLITYLSNHGNIVNPLFENITVTATEPGNVSANGVTFQGMFAPVHITSYEENTTQDYLFLAANNQLAWPANDATSMRGFRAYFIIDRQVITPSMAPRNSRARIVEHTDTTTDIETTNLKSEIINQKIIRNGHLIIIRGDKEYDAQGQLIK